MRRKTQIAVLLGFLFGTSAAGYGQRKIALHDVSEHGAPLRVSGTISFDVDPSQAIRYTYRTQGSVANVSDRDVVLTAIHIEASGENAPGLDSDLVVDRFFGPTLLRAGQSEKIDMPPVSFETPTVNSSGPPIPVATAKVTFVQFADGSTWGDAEAGGRLIRQRTGTLWKLTKFEQDEQLLHAQGADVRELLDSFWNRQFPAIGALLSDCKSKAGSCLIDGLHSMLEAAREHQLEMTDPQSATSSNGDASPQPITSQDTSKAPLKADDRVAPCPAEFTIRSLPDGIYRVGGDVMEPMPTQTAEATLSSEAREFIKEHHVKQFEAISLVGLTVDTNGMPQDICVLKKAGYGLDREALGAAAKYRFKPATLNGKPVPVRVTIGVKFANFPSGPSFGGG